MAPSDYNEQVPSTTTLGEKPPSSPLIGGGGSRFPLLASQALGRSEPSRPPSVFVFNPFAEGYIARGKAFTPVKHQAMLAEDLANLPQFLCQPEDVVLVAKRPSAGFLSALQQAGFAPPEFVELREGHIAPAGGLCQRKLGSLRPWAWGPDSVKLFEPLFGRTTSDARSASQCFNDDIARLYSKAWSAGFLKKVLAHWGGDGSSPRDGLECGVSGDEPSPPLGQSPVLRLNAAAAAPWICSEQEAGVAVDSLEDALEAIAAIRRRGHHRVVVKEAHGLAGHNAIRLWEPEILPAHRQWLAHALQGGRQLVVEPWLERELDFSVQLEMGPCGLQLCGYTGLVNDRKGQFLANWAEADYSRSLPAEVAGLLGGAHSGPKTRPPGKGTRPTTGRPADIAERLQRLYGELFSLLEVELQRAGFGGPVSIDAFVYRTAQGDCRLKPVVEINPRYTMGRLTLELMKHTSPGSSGLFRLVTRGQARAEGFADLSAYATALSGRLRLRSEDGAKIRQGALCLNDPAPAQVCLATFEVSPSHTNP